MGRAIYHGCSTHLRNLPYVVRCQHCLISGHCAQFELQQFKGFVEGHQNGALLPEWGCGSLEKFGFSLTGVEWTN